MPQKLITEKRRSAPFQDKPCNDGHHGVCYEFSGAFSQERSEATCLITSPTKLKQKIWGFRRNGLLMSKLFSGKCVVAYVDDSADDQFLFKQSVLITETPLQIQQFFSAEPLIPYLKGELPFEDRDVHPFPAFLLCDYNLKTGRASDFLPVLRAIPFCEALPIIMLSGSDDEDCVSQCYAVGADHFLRKPISSHRLSVLVKSLYACAVSKPMNFDGLRQHPEYQPAMELA